MFLKQPKIRQFGYSPRFYQPASSEEEGDERRIKFRRLTDRKPVRKRSFWGMLIIILLLVLLIRYLFSVIRSERKEFKFEDLKIEAIE